VRLPKPKRTKDKALLKALRLGHCELCGRADMGLQVHHVVSKGSGGPDARENLITLCRLCHLRAHAGEIDKAALWAIVARREGITPEEAESEARELTRRAHSG
jgi:5-methylcytosine-specific restriction endonuclease McrA